VRMFGNLLLFVPCVAVSCANLGPNPYVQPQAVNGPCTVKPFFIIRLSETPTEMKTENTGQACVISMFNPDLGAVQDAAFVSLQPAHGQAWTQIFGGDRGTVVVFYKPAAAYVGPDLFDVTFEPEARDVLFHVTVTPPGVPAG
jgi:hypothetical protein